MIADTGDWEGLYIDGDLKYEESTLILRELHDCLEVPCTLDSFEIKNVDQDWWYEQEEGSFPQSLDEVKFV